MFKKKHPVIWKRNIYKKRKHKIFNTTARSIMTYEADIWVTNKKITEKILAVETAYWRQCNEVKNIDTRRASASKWLGIVTV